MANIKVAVRVRPISEREIQLTGSEMVVHTDPKTISLTNLKVSSNKAGDSRERIRRYGFDYCFDSSDPTSENYASQENIYETLGQTILDALFKRYNSCLVAYGQSASGKTYTMMGSKQDPGLTPRICEGLFRKLANDEKNDGSFCVSVSYLEVYNERVRDLLGSSSNCVGLKVREHPRLGPYVQGLTRHAVPTLSSLISRVEEGTRARKTASTLQNPTSSRSHALLTLSLLPISDNIGQSIILSATNSSNDSVPRRNHYPRGGKLHLVDLAGSESAAACGGINRLKEGANINKSLVALGNVISALAERGSVRSSPGRRFIPYRDSALTWLLKDALGGNATTVMLAAISPASGSYNETSHTLRFAQRARSVVNRPVINEDPVSRIIRELRAEVARLKSLLLEKNVNSEIVGKSVCLCHSDEEKELNNVTPKTRAIGINEGEEETEESIESKESKCLNSDKYNEAQISEVFVKDETNEPVVFVDIPTLVAVLIKPDTNNQVDSHKIEEIRSDVVLEEAIDREFEESVDPLALPESKSSSNSQIDERQSEDCETSVDRRARTKLQKQDSIDCVLSSRKETNFQSLKKYGSIESLSRKKEFVHRIERSKTNLEKRNNCSLEKSKKLNNIKEIEDRKLSKLSNSWRSFGASTVRDFQDKVIKDSCEKSRNQTNKRNVDGAKRKTSKESSSSSSSRKGSLDQEEIPVRFHTPIQRARRAEIVAAVTERLYTSKKISEDGNTATTTGTTASNSASDVRSPESNVDVKLATATRMRLQEISRKMLAKRRRISVDTQTDNRQTVRVRDTASITEEIKIVRKDASILTDRHQDYEILPSTDSSVLRVKEISTLTDLASLKKSVVRCKDAAILTENHCQEDYPAIGSLSNDFGTTTDDISNYFENQCSSTEIENFSGNTDRKKVADHSTNTIRPLGPSNSGSQTRSEDFVETGCPCRESRCCIETKSCQGFDGSINANEKQSCRRTEKNVISISLPDMISITIESSNNLESKIKVFDNNEGTNVEERASTSVNDNEAQTDAKDTLETGTTTDDVFGEMSLKNFSTPAKPIIGQTDGKSFRIENIFHETVNATRINPRIEILSRNDVAKNSLTVTNSVGTCFVPETRENATGMERSTNYSFNECFDRENHKNSIDDDSFVKNTLPEKWRSRVANEMEIRETGKNLLERDTNFSDDSLDPLDDPDKNSRDNCNLDIELNSEITKIRETKDSEKACPPDVVAHTNKDVDESSITNKNVVVECEDFEDSEQIVFPKIKLDSTVSTSSATPISDFKSLILGNSCCNIKRVDDSNFTDFSCKSTFKDKDYSCTNYEAEENAKQYRLYSERSEEPKSIIKKPSQRKPNSRVSDEYQVSFDSRNFEGQSRYKKKVHFAVPEVFELTSSDSEMFESLSSEDENLEGDGPSILEEYLDEAVIFMRNMNSMNEYMSAARAFDKYMIKDRMSSNYIKYNERRDEARDVNSDFNVESYEKCMRSIDRLEKCLAKVKRHDKILVDKYGIEIGGSTGAKHDLAKSNVDSRLSNDRDKSEYSRTMKNEKKYVKYCESDDDDGDSRILKKPRYRGFRRILSDIRKKNSTTYSELRGKYGGSSIDSETKKKEEILCSDSKVKISKIDESIGTTEAESSSQTPECYSTLPKTKRIVMGVDDGIKSFASRSRFSLSKYDSSNESSSSNEALESFMESIDIATRSRDKFKYPGSPRSKFLQLLSERRRIVENTRKNGVTLERMTFE